MLRTIAKMYDGTAGVWAYDCYEAINGDYFGGMLPTARIVWAPTNHPECMAFLDGPPSRPPTIVLDPGLLGGGRWDGVPPQWLGPDLAWDVLFHEMIHISVDCILSRGGDVAFDGHDNEGWYREVVRLLPLLGFEGIEIDSIPWQVLARFPGGLRKHLGTADEWYQASPSGSPNGREDNWAGR
jgi:hypothetical protein